MSNPLSDLVLGFQGLVAAVPELVQPLIIAAAGAVPFIEGEGAAAIGIIGGIHPLVAVLAAAIGNLLCVGIVVLATSRVRAAVTTRRGAPTTTPTARREKFEKAYHRYGTPGVSLLGPLLLPTQFTAAALTSTGVSPARVLGWQATAIALWTTGVTLVALGLIRIAA
ncbi:MAG: small multidrug efflux protein [Microbacterium sp. 71-36]|uniref:small multidrug efflux protein n=1 Tax=unclassified Microbacterium TaxID=2609290 RepID=UPI00086AF196|nr:MULTISPECIES: small multidrug efflux protein [unclassified Microbacterium]ODT38625.1 MAG: small multidrug efflux protein [Microbacterium sp. SCN 71-17]ODU52756.1 MAG: small multidrug efflux protein [Microbacterium sp. SCN 70-10]OJV76004.1 MAG: small multidrug efflux protein [Microbacterium sp. 71-36]